MQNSTNPKRAKNGMPLRKATISGFLAAICLGSILATMGCQKSDGNTGPTSATTKITLLSPNGGETFKVGDTLWIKWSTKDDPNDPINAVDMLISPDSGKTWGYINGASIPLESNFWGKFPWIVRAKPATGPSLDLLSSHCLIRVQEYSTSDTTRMSTTRSTFTITNSVAIPY